MINRFLLTLCAITFSLLGCNSTTNTTHIKQVIFPGDYPDPTIIRDGGNYYMTHSSFTYYPGLLIWHSTDLENWTPVARAVTDRDYSIFAPELCKVDDTYYIYYPTSRGENFVVTAQNIEGPWSEPVKIDVNGIDPGHVVETDGKRYLYTNNGHVIALSDDGLSATGRNRKVYDGWQYPEEWETEGMWLESPKICKYGDYYYMVSAEGGTAGPPTSHMCVVARSKSAVGPWENSPYNPMVHTYSDNELWWSKGHGTLIDDPQGNWYIVYHAYKNGYHTLGRSTIIESVVWSEDGWPLLANSKGAEWDDVEPKDFDYLRHFDNPIMWSRWEPGFMDGDLWTTTAIDESYQIMAEFTCTAGAKGGLYLFYNNEAFVGRCLDDPHFYIRITNIKNLVDVEISYDKENWVGVESKVDVSTYHHNRYQGFFALRPSILTTEGCQVKDFEYSHL